MASTPADPGAEAVLPDGRASIHELLDVEILEAGPERVVMRLPVDWKVHQPYGILHGGVSALLAESAASFGAALAADPYSLYTILQVLSVSVFERVPLYQLFTRTNYKTENPMSCKQLNLFDQIPGQ